MQILVCPILYVSGCPLSDNLKIIISMNDLFNSISHKTVFNLFFQLSLFYSNKKIDIRPNKAYSSDLTSQVA